MNLQEIEQELKFVGANGAIIEFVKKEFEKLLKDIEYYKKRNHELYEENQNHISEINNKKSKNKYYNQKFNFGPGI